MTTKHEIFRRNSTSRHQSAAALRMCQGLRFSVATWLQSVGGSRPSGPSRQLSSGSQPRNSLALAGLRHDS